MKKIFVTLAIVLASQINAQNDPTINYKLGLAQNFEQAGQFDKAEPLYRELLQLQPLMYQFFESLNRIYIAQKKYNESIMLIETRIKDNPQDPNLYCLLGTTYFIMDNTAKAYETWERGLAANPHSIISYRVIANAAIENRAYEKAIEYLQRGKKLSNDDYVFSMDLANIYAATMNFEKAVTMLCELVASHPEQVNIVKTRIAAFVTRPLAAQQTIKAVRNYVDSKPTLELYDLLAFTYQQTGDFENSYETIKKSESEFNGNGRSMLVFAQTVFQLQQYKYAAQGFKYVLDNYPKSDYSTVARISYAKAMEESLNQENDSAGNSWKPLSSPAKVNTQKYLQIIKAYDDFIKSTPNSAYSGEAFFRIAEIYRTRIFELQKADSIYQIVIKNYPQINQTILAKIARGKTALVQDKLDLAKQFFEDAVNSQQRDPNSISEALFYLARIEFWKGNFSIAQEKFKEATKNLDSDYANDALELSFLINTVKNDSLNLLQYAKANLLLLQNNLKQAAIEFKTLADNDNLFIINQFAKMEMAKIFVLEDDFFSGIQLLENVINSKETAIFAEKCIFLLGQTYQYGIKNLQKAEETYQKVLEKFPNSIYFDHARDELNRIQTKNGQ